MKDENTEGEKQSRGSLTIKKRNTKKTLNLKLKQEEASKQISKHAAAHQTDKSATLTITKTNVSFQRLIKQGVSNLVFYAQSTMIKQGRSLPNR